MITTGQLLDFVLKYREDKVFKGFTKAQVAAAITEGIQDGTLFYIATFDEKICGVVLAHKLETPKVLFVVENLAMSLTNLKVIATKAKREFPGYRIEAMRHNKHRRFDTEKLYRKLKI